MPKSRYIECDDSCKTCNGFGKYKCTTVTKNVPRRRINNVYAQVKNTRKGMENVEVSAYDYSTYLECHSSCTTCNGEGRSKCTTCSDTKYLSSQNKCKSKAHD